MAKKIDFKTPKKGGSRSSKSFDFSSLDIKTLKKFAPLALLLLFLIGVIFSCGGDEPESSSSGVAQEKEILTEAEEVTKMQEMTSSGIPKLTEAQGQGSPWINSNLEGNLSSKTKFSERDDFYEAVNHEWLTGRETDIQPEEVVQKKMLDVMKGNVEEDSNKNNIDNDVLWYGHSHDYWALRESYKLLSDWDTRNKNGAAITSRLIAEIAEISSMNTLYDYIIDLDKNAGGFELLTFSYTVDKQAPSKAMLQINGPALMLGIPDAYQTPKNYTHEYTDLHQEVIYLLKKIGYSESKADTIWRQAYRYEVSLAERMYSQEEIGMQEFEGYEYMSVNDVANSCAWPVKDVMEGLGISYSGTAEVTCPQLITDMKELYRRDYLENIKSWMMCKTVLKMRYLMDYQTAEYCYKLEHDDEEMNDDTLFYITMDELAPSLMDNEYIRNYGDAAVKQDMQGLAVFMTDEIHTLMDNTYWLSTSAKEMVVKKLNSMPIYTLYPDFLPDLSLLDSGGSLTDTGIIGIYNMSKRQEISALQSILDNTYINPIWNTEHSPRKAECNYADRENAFYLSEAYLENELKFSKDSKEITLAGVGFQMAREILHAVDENGALLDEFGNNKSWWSDEDRSEYLVRSKPLTDAVNSIVAMDNISYDGVRVRRETASDLTAMMLINKKTQEEETFKSFDYKEFYRAFARSMRAKYDAKTTREIFLKGDAMLPYARVNLVVAQFESFKDAFRVRGNDGMTSGETSLFIWGGN